MDAAYAVVVRAMFSQLERTAGPDVKHGDRLRLENYTVFEDKLKPLTKRVRPACACISLLPETNICTVGEQLWFGSHMHRIFKTRKAMVAGASACFLRGGGWCGKGGGTKDLCPATA